MKDYYQSLKHKLKEEYFLILAVHQQLFLQHRLSMRSSIKTEMNNYRNDRNRQWTEFWKEINILDQTYQENQKSAFFSKTQPYIFHLLLSNFWRRKYDHYYFLLYSFLLFARISKHFNRKLIIKGTLYENRSKSSALHCT